MDRLQAVPWGDAVVSQDPFFDETQRPKESQRANIAAKNPCYEFVGPDVPKCKCARDKNCLSANSLPLSCEISHNYAKCCAAIPAALLEFDVTERVLGVAVENSQQDSLDTIEFIDQVDQRLARTDRAASEKTHDFFIATPRERTIVNVL